MATGAAADVVFQFVATCGLRGFYTDRNCRAPAPEKQASIIHSIRVPPGSRTIKGTLGPLPDSSGANSIRLYRKVAGANDDVAITVSVR